MQATIQDVSTKKRVPSTNKKALKKPITTLKINEFEIDVDLAHQNACGGATKGSFYVSCNLSAREIDANGFVIEVDSFKNEVWNSFNVGGMIKASCEELAGGVVNVACREIGSRLVRVIVEVTNHTGSVEMVWHKGDQIPPFPRLATDQEKKATLEARDRGEKPQPC